MPPVSALEGILAFAEEARRVDRLSSVLGLDCPIPLAHGATNRLKPDSTKHSTAALNAPGLNALRFLPFLQESFPDLLQCGSKQFEQLVSIPPRSNANSAVTKPLGQHNRQQHHHSHHHPRPAPYDRSVAAGVRRPVGAHAAERNMAISTKNKMKPTHLNQTQTATKYAPPPLPNPIIVKPSDSSTKRNQDSGSTRTGSSRSQTSGHSSNFSSTSKLGRGSAAQKYPEWPRPKQASVADIFELDVEEDPIPIATSSSSSSAHHYNAYPTNYAQPIPIPIQQTQQYHHQDTVYTHHDPKYLSTGYQQQPFSTSPMIADLGMGFHRLDVADEMEFEENAQHHAVTYGLNDEDLSNIPVYEQSDDRVTWWLNRDMAPAYFDGLADGGGRYAP